MSPLTHLPHGSIWYASRCRPETIKKNIILIHGAGGDHLSWPSQVRNLTGYRVLALDLPGHGRSAGPGRSTIDDYGKDILSFMDSVNVDKAILVGYSMGGAIALWMALNHAEKVEKLVLMATGARLPVSLDILNGLVKDHEKTLALIVSWSFGPTAAQNLQQLTLNSMRETDPDVIYSDFIACNLFDIRDRLAEIQTPSLIIGGDKDKMTPLKYSQYLSDHLTNAQSVTIQDGGHMLVLEHPDKVAQTVLQFLDSQPKIVPNNSGK